MRVIPCFYTAAELELSTPEMICCQNNCFLFTIINFIRLRIVLVAMIIVLCLVPPPSSFSKATAVLTIIHCGYYFCNGVSVCDTKSAYTINLLWEPLDSHNKTTAQSNQWFYLIKAAFFHNYSIKYLLILCHVYFEDLLIIEERAAIIDAMPW